MTHMRRPRSRRERWQLFMPGKPVVFGNSAVLPDVVFEA
jgi:hypothetical protein